MPHSHSLTPPILSSPFPSPLPQPYTTSIPPTPPPPHTRRGVDLNRNFPDPNVNKGVDLKQPLPESQPEVRAMMAFTLAHGPFAASANMHEGAVVSSGWRAGRQ